MTTQRGNLEEIVSIETKLDCRADWDGTIIKGVSSALMLHALGAERQKMAGKLKLMGGGLYFLIKDRLHGDVTEQIKYCASFLKGLDFGYVAHSIGEKIQVNPRIERINSYYPNGGSGPDGKILLGVVIFLSALSVFALTPFSSLKR